MKIDMNKTHLARYIFFETGLMGQDESVLDISVVISFTYHSIEQGLATLDACAIKSNKWFVGMNRKKLLK